MNKVCLIGRLTRDPDMKMTQNGKKMATFVLAVDRPYRGQDGERSADFIRCICYERTAELVEKYLAKGRKLAVEGHIHTGSYQNDGKMVYTTDVSCDRIEFVESSSAAQPQGKKEEEPHNETGNFIEVENANDELPF